MLSNASKYAIRAVLYLADNSNENLKHSAIEISQALEIPNYFIAKLLQLLAKNNIISSSKGPNGGFYMNSSNLDLKVCDILEVIEMKKLFKDCFLGLPVCSSENPCPIHHIVVEFRNQILEKFHQQSIKELAFEIKSKGTYITHKGIPLKF